MPNINRELKCGPQRPRKSPASELTRTSPTTSATATHITVFHGRPGRWVSETVYAAAKALSVFTLQKWRYQDNRDHNGEPRCGFPFYQRIANGTIRYFLPDEGEVAPVARDRGPGEGTN